MDCLRPIAIKNPKYRYFPYQELKGDIDGVYKGQRDDDSKLLVPCGKCKVCLRKKERETRFRLYQETINSESSIFITLTVSDEYMDNFKTDPKKMFRLWFDRFRKRYGSSPRHWIVSELGSTTHRLHFHGILWNCDITKEDLESSWKYGFVHIGYCNKKTINYVTKYLHKPQLNEEWYTPFKLQSNRPGIGYQYVNSTNINYHLKNGIMSYYNGFPIGLPRYYREKIFSAKRLRSMAVDYNRYIETNLDTYKRKKLQSVGVSSISEFLSFSARQLRNTLKLGESIPIKHKNNNDLLNFVQNEFI